MISFNLIATEENTEQNYDLNDILYELVIALESLWKEVTEASKIHSQLNKDNQDEIFAKYSNWPKDKQMQGYMWKLRSEKITGNYYSVHAKNSSSKFILHLMVPYSPLSKKYFQWIEYDNIINCLLSNQKLPTKSENFIRILKLFFQKVNINDFEKLDNSHRINIVNRINDISKYCSLESIMKLDYINNIKNIMKNTKDPWECFNALSLYSDIMKLCSIDSLSSKDMQKQILLLMINNIKDNYYPEENQIFNGIIDKLDKLFNNHKIYGEMKGNTLILTKLHGAIQVNPLMLIQFLAHKEINGMQLLNIVIDAAISNITDPNGELSEIKKTIFYNAAIYEKSEKTLDFSVGVHNYFTPEKIEIINHNIREFSKSDKKDRQFI